LATGLPPPPSPWQWRQQQQLLQQQAKILKEQNAKLTKSLKNFVVKCKVTQTRFQNID
jgi:hypothetical protein